MSKETRLLKKKLDTTFEILLQLEIMKNNSERIADKSSKHFARACSNSQFLNSAFHAYNKMFIIELYKLIDPNGDYRMRRTLNYCKLNINKIEWYSKPTIVFLDELETKIEFKKEIVDKIKILRDKFYAHTDKNRYNNEYLFDKNEMWFILEKLQYVFRLLCQEFNNICWIFSLQYKGIPELKMISKYREIREVLMDKKADNINIISIEELEDLMYI